MSITISPVPVIQSNEVPFLHNLHHLGTTFDITVAYTVVNDTGTGDIVIDINTVDHFPVGEFIYKNVNR